MRKFIKYYQLNRKSKQYESFLKKLSNKTTSREFFQLPNNQFEENRKALHKNIVDKYLNQCSSQKPYIHFILGSIGSGKTSLKDSVVRKEEVKSFLYINFDDLKNELPEYKILKELNRKKAANFVQSESAKLAGTLYRKAINKKVNIIYEKNLRLNKEGDLHLISEIKDAFRKNYTISIHVVFLNSYEEAWKRVKTRADKIRRFVRKSEVKETFINLFPNLNILLNINFTKSYLLKLWYNGEWNVRFSRAEEQAHNVGGIFFNPQDWPPLPVSGDFIYGCEEINNLPYCYIFPLANMNQLPKTVKKTLKKLKCLEKIQGKLNL